MPSLDVNAPVSSAPSDWLALGVGWVRPGVGGIGTLNPSGLTPWAGGIGTQVWLNSCFEGNEE